MELRQTATMAMLLIASALPVLCQPAQTPADVLEIVALLYDPGSSTLTFGVVNRSAKPVLAYGVKITSKFPDGSTQAIDLRQDLVRSLLLVGKVANPKPDDHFGELRPGESLPWRTGMGGKNKSGDRAISVAVEPDVVIFSDNSVLGTNKETAERIFASRQAARDGYAHYRQLVRAIQGSLDIERRVGDLRSAVMRADAGENVFKRPAADHKWLESGSEYVQFRYGLESVLRCIRLKTATQELCLSHYVQELDSALAVYSAHAEPAGGVK